MPLMPLQLTFQERQVDVIGLLDTAASVSVLPFSAGLALGAVWEQQSVQLDLVGNLANFEARALLLTGIIEGSRLSASPSPGRKPTTSRSCSARPISSWNSTCFSRARRYFSK